MNDLTIKAAISSDIIADILEKLKGLTVYEANKILDTVKTQLLFRAKV